MMRRKLCERKTFSLACHKKPYHCQKKIPFSNFTLFIKRKGGELNRDCVIIEGNTFRGHFINYCKIKKNEQK